MFPPSTQIYPSVFFHSDAAQNIVLAPLRVLLALSLTRPLFLHVNVEDIFSALIRSVSWTLGNVPSLQRTRCLTEKIFRAGLDLNCITCHAVAEVSQVRLSLARMSPLCTVDIRIRSPLQPHYCTLSKNRKPKIDSRRRYKLYEIYWVWEETIAAVAHGWPSGKTVESNSVDWIVSTLSGEDLSRSKLLVPCDQSSDDIVRSHARDWRVFKYIRK